MGFGFHEAVLIGHKKVAVHGADAEDVLLALGAFNEIGGVEHTSGEQPARCDAGMERLSDDGIQLAVC